MWTFRRCLGVCVLFLATSLLLATVAPAAQVMQGQGVIKVMTYNVNEGTDFVEVLGAQTVPDFLAAVQITLDSVKASNPPLRMQAVARQIAETQPDLVGLQEVTTYRVGPGPNPAPVLFDMLQELLGALEAHGQHYVVAIVVPEFDFQAPLPDLTTFVRASGSNVILARSGEDRVQLSNIQSAHYLNLLTFPTQLGPLTLPRGWGSVDVTFHGRSVRFIVTHLENFVPQFPPTLLVQEAQAAELIAGPANTTMPVVIAGDFNANADNPNDPTFATYQEMIGNSFGDAWAATHPDNPGFTWDLNNTATSPLNQRIDFIFFRDGVQALNSRLAGARIQDRIDGLWPSDHAGVRATLLVGLD